MTSSDAANHAVSNEIHVGAAALHEVVFTVAAQHDRFPSLKIDRTVSRQLKFDTSAN
jgi:hypothetical protein